MAERYRVCTTEELQPGERKIVDAGGRSIGVFNVGGSYHALLNLCPHQRGPLCLGQVTGTMLPSEVGEFRYDLEGRIIRCPWHGWEFDLTTGKSVFKPDRVKLKVYPVTVEPACPGSPAKDEPRVETFSGDGGAPMDRSAPLTAGAQPAFLTGGGAPSTVCSRRPSKQSQ